MLDYLGMISSPASLTKAIGARTIADTTARFGRVLVFTAAAAVALAACSSTAEPAIEASARSSTGLPELIVVNEEIQEPTTTDDLDVVSPAIYDQSVPAREGFGSAPVPTPTTVPDAVTPTTTVPITGRITLPHEVDGVFSEQISEHHVVTSVDDPLNVRSGPGVEYSAIDQLNHGFTNFVSSDAVTLDSGATWRFISVGTEPAGWVHGAFIQPVANTSSCEAPAYEDAVAGFELIHEPRFGDIDGDGLDDEVSVHYEVVAIEGVERTFNQHFFHLYVRYGNGGTALSAPIQGDRHPAANGVWGFADVSYLPTDPGGDEILLGLGSGSTTAFLAVVAQVDCDVVATTLDGGFFGVSQGASGTYSSSFGCAFGAHGETSLLRYSDNDRGSDEFTATTEEFRLRGSEWVSVGTFDNNDPTVTPPSSSDCGF